MSKASTRPVVGIIMGSQSDWETMRHAAEVLGELGVAHETRIVSAHRTPKRLYEYAQGAAGRGLKIIIAGAGGAAHLPGMAAALTLLPVLGVPVESKALKGLDSLLSIAQMPKGIPVLTFAIGPAGAANAGLAAAGILALGDGKPPRWRKSRRAEPLSFSNRRLHEFKTSRPGQALSTPPGARTAGAGRAGAAGFSGGGVFEWVDGERGRRADLRARRGCAARARRAGARRGAWLAIF
jgi:5-(carboxyamino)imidazole ribonucleotide mutase